MTKDTPYCISGRPDIRKNPFKQDFELLAATPELAFLDNAATTQRPECVLDAQRHFYTAMNANPLRGLYRLSVDATAAIAGARTKAAAVIGADDPACLVFTRNTSESLNLVAKAFAPKVLGPGDEVAITIMEHHSNLIPWQEACRAAGARLVYLYPEQWSDGIFSQEELAKITPKTKIVAATQLSNVLGCELPIRTLADAVHKNGGYMVVDGAQSVPHLPVDVSGLGADFFAYSAHKALGPMGVGMLWGRRPLLELADPMLTGGEMIDYVSTTDATWAPLPEKFEAGTQDAAGIYASGVALDYLTQHVGIAEVAARESALVAYAMKRMEELPYIELIGSADPAWHHGVISFNVAGVHPHDVASILDMQQVCIRAGHHCAQPLLAWLAVENHASCRVSFAFYNDADDIDRFISALSKVWQVFHGRD